MLHRKVGLGMCSRMLVKITKKQGSWCFSSHLIVSQNNIPVIKLAMCLPGMNEPAALETFAVVYLLQEVGKSCFTDVYVT